MNVATAAQGPVIQTADRDRLHFVLRFSVATTVAFVVCEWMEWQPSAFAPVLTAVLLANLPTSPPPKVGIALVAVTAASAWFAFFLTTWLSQAPNLLFLAIGVVIFLVFAGLAQAKAQLPLTLLLICITVIPVATLTFSQFAGVLPGLLVRAMALAIILTWVAFAIWPRPSPHPPEPPSAPGGNPIIAATLGTAIVLPVMLVFLLFGLTDAIPVLLTTALLVAKMEEERSAASAWAKLVGNFLGGFVAVAAYYVLAVTPTLAALTLITFIIGCGFGMQIARGGVQGGNALLGYNAAMIIFGLALLKGPDNSGTWGSRVVQFAIACSFAVGMMALLWPRTRTRSSPKPS